VTDSPQPQPQAEPLPKAARRRTLWSALIWALPLAALIIVAYLGIQWVAERGEVVTVTFAISGGARIGETKVTYQGVEAGHLIDIVPNEDGHRLDFKLRLVPEAKPGLNTNARFFLIGASPDLDLSSLRAVVSGVAIGYAPGEGGTPTRRFVGSDKAPVVLPGDRGTSYLLTARTLGSIHEGAILLFHGQPIGKVSEVKLSDEATFRLEVFVFQPYDALIKPGDRFWKIAPVRLSFAGGGLDANLAPISALLSGGIELDTSMASADGPQSPAESEFILYASRNAAQQGLTGPTVRFAFSFASAGGDLEEGAAVTLLGFQVGEVENTRLDYDRRSGEPLTTVTAVLYPQSLDPTGLAAGSVTDWQVATDEKVRHLIHMGYRARLEQSPLLIGARSIALVRMKGAMAHTAHTLTYDIAEYDGAELRIPSAPGSTSFDDLASQADQILAKVNRIPIEAIGENLKVLTGQVARLVSSPKVDDSLTHLHHSLVQLDLMLSQVQPQIGPLVSKLNEAAGEVASISIAVKQLLDGDGAAQDSSVPEAMRQLNETARSIRTLADYLDRHPEALIRGKSLDK
jgi:paraquat-inducible protein B